MESTKHTQKNNLPKRDLKNIEHNDLESLKKFIWDEDSFVLIKKKR